MNQFSLADQEIPKSRVTRYTENAAANCCLQSSVRNADHPPGTRRI